MSFNLVDEPWVLVQHVDGPRELSLSEVFAQSHQIRAIAGEIPTQGFAVLRMLLAICHHAIGWHTLDDRDDLLDAGIDREAISRYLERWRERFDLFHRDRPFMQVVDLRTAKDEYSGLEKLIADVPNGEQFFTMRAGRGLERITAAEAARWLVHVQSFDPSGIRSGAVGDSLVKDGKGYPIGPSWAGQIGGVVLHGDNLAETLVNNLTITEKILEDVPFWAEEERHTARRAEIGHPAGPVQVLVWQSRRVRLVGDRDGVVGVVLAQGDRLTPQTMQRLEPMTGWRYSRPQSKKFDRDVYMPNKHEPGRALWRGLPSIIALDRPTQVEDRGGKHDAFISPRTLFELEPDNHSVVIQAVGMSYGAQEAVTEEIVDDRVELHRSLLSEDGAQVRAAITDAVAVADECVRAIGQLAANLARAAGEKGDNAGDGARNRAMESAWGALDAPARRWIGGLDAESDVIAEKRAWEQTVDQIVRGLGDELANAAGPAANRGRETSFGFVSSARAHDWFLRAIRKHLPIAHPRITEEAAS